MGPFEHPVGASAAPSIVRSRAPPRCAQRALPRGEPHAQHRQSRFATKGSFMLLHKRARRKGAIRPRRLVALPVLLIGALVAMPEPAHAAGPSTPVLVSPSNGGSVNSGPGQLFTVRATDANGDPYFATVEVSSGISFTTTVAPAGQDSTGTPTTPIPPGTWTWRAKATTKADTSTSPPGGTVTDTSSGWSAWQSFTVQGGAPSAPELVAPASGGAVNGGPGQLFTVRATDPEGDAYTATVEVSVTGSTAPPLLFDTTPGKSGERVTGTPTAPVPPGTHSWRARAVDVHGNVGPWSASQTFDVTAPANTGLGQMSGEVNFDDPGQPGLLQDCGTTNFSLTPIPVDAEEA